MSRYMPRPIVNEMPLLGPHRAKAWHFFARSNPGNNTQLTVQSELRYDRFEQNGRKKCRRAFFELLQRLNSECV